MDFAALEKAAAQATFACDAIHVVTLPKGADMVEIDAKWAAAREAVWQFYIAVHKPLNERARRLMQDASGPAETEDA